MVSVPIWVFWTFIPLVFSIGVAIGGFGSRFVARKDCQRYRNELWDKAEECERDRTEIRENVASIRAL